MTYHPHDEDYDEEYEDYDEEYYDEEEFEREQEIEQLAESLYYVDGVVWKITVKTFIEAGKPAVRPMIKALADWRDSRLRSTAAFILGEIGDKRAVKPLIYRLEDREWQVRAVAAGALGKIGDERAVEPLTKVLKDGYEQVREAAKWALERIKKDASG